MKTSSHPTELKSERFTRLAERRATEVISKVRLIGNLSDKKNYDYSEDQVKQLFDALEAELRSCKSRFKSAENLHGVSGFTFKK